MTLVPRLLQLWISAGIITIALAVGIVQAVLVGNLAGQFTAIALGALVCPAMLRGARRGRMRTPVAWAVAAVGATIPVLATAQVSPDEATYLSVSWYTCGVLAGAILVWLAQQRAAATAGIGALVVHTLWWAGPLGLIRLGVAAEVLLLGAMLLVYRTIRRVAEAADEAADDERRTILWQAEQDAFHLERRSRLRDAGRSAIPLLHRIVASGCELDERTREECRVLEQTIRDEIRGRRLLNDAVRAAVLEHRRRGAQVQVLDDGGLDGIAQDVLDPLLDEVAGLVASVRSSRVVIRTAAPTSSTAITVVATTPGTGADPDEDAEVDLWRAIPRPGAGAAAPADRARAAAPLARA